MEVTGAATSGTLTMDTTVTDGTVTEAVESTATVGATNRSIPLWYYGR